MGLIVIVLIVLVLFGGIGGVGYYGPRASWGGAHYGWSLGSILIVVLLLLWLTGNLPAHGLR
jgi:hypothetical protein